MRAYVVKDSNIIELNKYTKYNKFSVRGRCCSRISGHGCKEVYPPVNCKIDEVCEKCTTHISEETVDYILDTDSICKSIMANKINIEIGRINFRYLLENSRESLESLVRQLNGFNDIKCLKDNKTKYTIVDTLTGNYIVIEYLERCNCVYVGGQI